MCGDDGCAECRRDTWICSLPLQRGGGRISIRAQVPSHSHDTTSSPTLSCPHPQATAASDYWPALPLAFLFGTKALSFHLTLLVLASRSLHPITLLTSKKAFPGLQTPLPSLTCPSHESDCVLPTTSGTWSDLLSWALSYHTHTRTPPLADVPALHTNTHSYPHTGVAVSSFFSLHDERCPGRIRRSVQRQREEC